MRRFLDDKYLEIVSKENPELVRDHYKRFEPCLQEIRGENVDSEGFLRHINSGEFMAPGKTTEQRAQDTMRNFKNISDEAREEGLDFAGNIHVLTEEWGVLYRISQKVVAAQLDRYNIKGSTVIGIQGTILAMAPDEAAAAKRAMVMTGWVNKLSDFYVTSDLPYLGKLLIASETQEILTFISATPKVASLIVGLHLYTYGLPTILGGNGGFTSILKRTMYSVSFKTIYRNVGSYINSTASSFFTFMKGKSFVKTMAVENLQKIVREATDAAIDRNISDRGDPIMRTFLNGSKDVLYSLSIMALKSLQIYIETKIGSGVENSSTNSTNLSNFKNSSESKNSSSRKKK